MEFQCVNLNSVVTIKKKKRPVDDRKCLRTQITHARKKERKNSFNDLICIRQNGM